MKYDINEQYQSMHRAYSELKNIAKDIGSSIDIGDPIAYDKTKTFFMECYHFKDWLKKDSRITDSKSVELYINSSQALSRAADLCNSLKHAGLTGAPRSGESLDKISMSYTIDIPKNVTVDISMSKNPNDGDTFTIVKSNRTGRAIASAKVILTIGGNKCDAVKLADECIVDWGKFLVLNSIFLIQ